MGKFDRVLLACDFDNTLVYTEPALVAGEPIPPLTAENREALESFTAQGGHFAVATGRALAAMRAIVPGLPINSPCVLCNGAALYDFTRGEYLDCNLLDEAALRRGQSPETQPRENNRDNARESRPSRPRSQDVHPRGERPAAPKGEKAEGGDAQHRRRSHHRGGRRRKGGEGGAPSAPASES